MAQPNPEARLQSLPPILRRTSRNSLPSCSKGSWGLSVLPRVEGIFTPNAISLSPLSRQCGCCYAIRAGRNFVFLPRFPVAQTIPSPDRNDLRMSLPEYFRFPDGFISIASLTISSKPLGSRCLPASTRRQTLWSRSTSACLGDRRGYVLKWGSTRSTRCCTFLTSYFTVLSDRSGRMNPQSQRFWIS